ncbi:MAG: DHH family phosphoesterase [Psychrobacillus sp.]
MKWVQRKEKVTPQPKDLPIDAIAKIRGIKDVNRFLNPTKDEMFDPYLMKNIEEASNRIIKAIKTGENIVVSYDPDADGLTSATTMIRYLRNYTDKVDYIYGERNDGHGIYEMLKMPKGEDNEERRKRAEDNFEKIKNCNLLILIDSSSNDTKICQKIVETTGCEIIVLDHHAIERDNPHVLLVNPQQEGCQYPNKQLSGAGVVYKTIQVMEDTLGEVDVDQYMDLVAVGMYADVMRVDVLENRYMIMHGLRNMKNAGLVRILKGAKADLYKLNGDSIGFSIAPLINGVARMDNIKLAIEILLEDDDAKCKPIRLKMQKINESRKILQKTIVDQYMTKVNQSEKALIVIDEQSSKGFNGIVAQQLTDIYKRPVIVGRQHGGTISGSFRSYNNFKFKSFLAEFGDIEALGHEGAGGIVLKEENLEALQKYINDNLPELEDEEPTILYDMEIEASEVPEYIKVVEQFNRLAGNGFPKVIMRVNGVTVEESACIGKTMETVKIKTFDEMELIKFKVNEHYASELGYFDTIDVVGQLQINEFYNFGTKQRTITNQVMILDYRTS